MAGDNGGGGKPGAAHLPVQRPKGTSNQQAQARRHPLGRLPPEPGRQRTPLLLVQRSGGYPIGDPGLRGWFPVAYRNGVRDGEERRGAGRVRDPQLGGLASPHSHVPAGWSVPAEPAAGLGGKRCPGSRGHRCTGWCGRCCPGSSSGPINCCCGWRIRSYATNGLAVPTRDAAPPAAKAGWSRHLKPVVVVLGDGSLLGSDY